MYPLSILVGPQTFIISTKLFPMSVKYFHISLKYLCISPFSHAHETISCIREAFSPILKQSFISHFLSVACFHIGLCAGPKGLPDVSFSETGVAEVSHGCTSHHTGATNWASESCAMLENTGVGKFG